MKRKEISNAQTLKREPSNSGLKTLKLCQMFKTLKYNPSIPPNLNTETIKQFESKLRGLLQLMSSNCETHERRTVKQTNDEL